jgi:hypothetical protein
MASKERNSKRRVGIDAEVTPLQLSWLRGEQLPDTFEALMLEYDKHGTNAALWAQHREMIIAEHIEQWPGTRPPLFWEHDVPRSSLKTHSGYHDVPTPRTRLGGTGTPAHEVLNWAPRFLLGLPLDWVNESDVEYWGGTMRHVVTGQLVNAKPAGSFAGVAIDEDDPPLYESEAAYLARPIRENAVFWSD